MLKICLLGHFDLLRKGVPIEISSRSAQSLIAYLVLNTGISHRREKLAGLFWPDATEANARSYLRKALWQARKSLEINSSGTEEYLIADDLSITFNSNAEYWLDVDTLESKSGETSSIGEQIEAVSMYHGELLPGFYEDWVILERERLRAVFEHKLQILLDRLIEAGRWAETLDWGERWIALGSTPEPAYRSLMVAHAALGDNAKVAATYERCVQTLEEELGVEPSKQTRELYEQLRSETFPLGEPSPVPIPLKQDPTEVSSSELDASDQRITNLPTPLTSFVGRENEIKEIKEFISEARLLTMTGPGGSGKTRLAIEVTNELRDSFRYGVWWIDLASLTDPNLVPQSVAKVLRVLELSNQSLINTLANSLQAKEILLVFDGCEHLLDACAQLGEHLLTACPGLKIIATSREVLGIPGERVFPVPTLSSPDPDIADLPTLKSYDAVCLFIERATTHKPDFALTDQNAQDIGHLLFGLDGIPLAIELAAARVQALSVEQMAARLDDRFRLLTGGSRTALPRHQTLLATLDWSYDLLSSDEQIVLQRLSVFSGGWSVAAAEFVCSGESIQTEDVLDLLSLLANKSLVLTERRPGEEARYRMLETIREYAKVKLLEAGEETLVRDRHLDFFVMLAEQAEPQLSKPNQVIWLERLEAELDNIRAAIKWSIDGGSLNDTKGAELRVIAGLRLMGSLGWFFERHSGQAPANLLTQLLSLPEAQGNTKWRAKALDTLGFMHIQSGKYREAQGILDEALLIAREVDELETLIWVLCRIGAVLTLGGKFTNAQPYLEEGLALALAMEHDSQFPIAWCLCFLGDISLNRGEIGEAESAYEESVAILRVLKNQSMLGFSARRLGFLALRRGDYSDATELFQESLLLNQAVNHTMGIAHCLAALAGVDAKQGNFTKAARLFGASEAVVEAIATPLYPYEQKEYDLNVIDVHERLGDEQFAAAWSDGRSMSLDEAIAYAMTPLKQG